MTRVGLLLLVGVLMGGGAVGRAEAADARHSGRVIAIDPAAGELRLEELTASAGPEPRTVERTLRLGPETSLRRVVRVAVDLAGWPNAWGEERTTIQALRPGDYVTVTTGQRGNTVLVLEVVQPEGG
jgi:hypothetical protein